jgi:hypothetical protein
MGSPWVISDLSVVWLAWLVIFEIDYWSLSLLSAMSFAILTFFTPFTIIELEFPDFIHSLFNFLFIWISLEEIGGLNL